MNHRESFWDFENLKALWRGSKKLFMWSSSKNPISKETLDIDKLSYNLDVTMMRA